MIPRFHLHPSERKTVEIMTQRIELLAVSPAECRGGEKTVVLTIRPDRGRWRPHNVALSRTQAIRLLKSLRIVLRQSAGLLLLSLILGSAGGCSVKVVTSETGPSVADAPPRPNKALAANPTSRIAER